MNKYDVALFDFDGTVTDSADGIRICIEKTLEKMNKPVPDLSDYSKYVGPVLLNTFQKVCSLTSEQAQQAVKIYVELYNDYGVRANRLFFGIEEVLKTLRQNGVKIVVCTCKNEKIALDVINYLGIYDLFDEICGADSLGTRKEKQEIIEYSLEKSGATDRSRVVMIGDSAFDAKGAQLCNIDFVGAAYGYGNIEEMRTYENKGFADNPQNLLEFLL